MICGSTLHQFTACLASTAIVPSRQLALQKADALHSRSYTSARALISSGTKLKRHRMMYGLKVTSIDSGEHV